MVFLLRRHMQRAKQLKFFLFRFFVKIIIFLFRFFVIIQLLFWWWLYGWVG